MSSDDSTGSGDNNILSGLPGPQSESVSPLHGGPRPKAAERNPFASSDQIEAQRPHEEPDQGASQDEADAPEAPVSEAPAAESTAVPEPTATQETAASPTTPAPTSAFKDDQEAGGSSMGVIIAVVVAIAAIAFLALR